VDGPGYKFLSCPVSPRIELWNPKALPAGSLEEIAYLLALSNNRVLSPISDCRRKILGLQALNLTRIFEGEAAMAAMALSSC